MKNKLFVCFRPVVVETETQHTHGGGSFDDRVFTCMTVSNQRDSKLSGAKSRVSTRERSKSSEHEIRTRKQRVAVNSFSGVVKAVLFGISLREKARKRKVPRQLILGSESSNRSRSDVFSHTNLRSDSSTSSSSSSTSSSSSNSSLSPKNVSNKRSYLESVSPTRKKQSIKCPEVQTESRVNGCLGSNAGLLILISLFITVFYGRLCAILFTSLCLYFLRSRSICHQQSPEQMVSSSPERELSAGDYRKRIIMEGLLGRNHQRRGR